MISSKFGQAERYYNVAEDKVGLYVPVLGVLTCDFPEISAITGSANKCPVCRPTVDYEEAEVNIDVCSKGQHPAAAAGILNANCTFKTTKQEHALYAAAAEGKSSASITKGRHALLQTDIGDFDCHVDIFESISAEKLHALVQRTSGRMITVVQDLLLSKYAAAIILQLYRSLVPKRKNVNETNNGVYAAASSMECPCLPRCNNAVTLTGRVKANNIEQYLGVIHIVYSYFFTSTRAEDVQECRKSFKRCVQAHHSFSSAAWRLRLFEALIGICEATVCLYRLLNGDPSEEELVLVEQAYLRLEKNAIMVDEVMPFRKGANSDVERSSEITDVIQITPAISEGHFTIVVCVKARCLYMYLSSGQQICLPNLVPDCAHVISYDVCCICYAHGRICRMRWRLNGMRSHRMVRRNNRMKMSRRGKIATTAVTKK